MALDEAGASEERGSRISAGVGQRSVWGCRTAGSTSIVGDMPIDWTRLFGDGFLCSLTYVYPRSSVIYVHRPLNPGSLSTQFT